MLIMYSSKIMMIMMFVIVKTLLSHSLEGQNDDIWKWENRVFVATCIPLKPIKTLKSTAHNFVNVMTAYDWIFLILEILNNLIQEFISHK